MWALGQLDLIDYMQLQKIQGILSENMAEGRVLNLSGVCNLISGLSVYYATRTYDLGILNYLIKDLIQTVHFETSNREVMGLWKSFLVSRYTQKPIFEHLTKVLIEKRKAGQQDEILYAYGLKCLALLEITDQYYELKESVRPLLLNLRVI